MGEKMFNQDPCTHYRIPILYNQNMKFVVSLLIFTRNLLHWFFREIDEITPHNFAENDKLSNQASLLKKCHSKQWNLL